MSNMNNAQLCDAKDSCLILIDIQEKLTQVMPYKVAERLRHHVSILLKSATRLDIPIIASAQYPKGLGQIERNIKALLPDTAQCVDKTCFSCYLDHDFKQQLCQLNKRQIILTGIEAHICVLQTALDLLTDGYDVFVVTDAIASRKAVSYESALSRMNQAMVKMVSTESVLFEWLRDAAHPEFKTVSQWII